MAKLYTDKINFKIPPDIRKEFKEYCALAGLTESQFLRSHMMRFIYKWRKLQAEGVGLEKRAS